MTDDQAPSDDSDGRSLEFAVEVDGTPEEVWRAVATGPGISSWYVPHEVEEREGGRASASFGPGPEMQVEAVVAAWDPPHRILFTSPNFPLAFEWLVEARDGGSCVVRLINSGFGSGEDWDGQYDGMAEGWPIFLSNLQLHLRHFRGQHARAVLPMATWTGEREAVWAQLFDGIGLPRSVALGDVVRTGPNAPAMSGTVVEVKPHSLALLLDAPAPGTAFVAVEGQGDQLMVSVWLYLYGDDRDPIAEHADAAWRSWLEARAAAG
jgi:uncharacterized protein YndB with AHSA1/START domain